MNTRALSFLCHGIREEYGERSKVSSPPGCNSAVKEKQVHCFLLHTDAGCAVFSSLVQASQIRT